MTGFYKIRLPKSDEKFVDGTMLDPSSDEIILLEKKNGKCELDIEEVLNHEHLHIAIARIENYLVSKSLDNISGWEKAQEDKKPHLAFYWNGKVIFQLPRWETFIIPDEVEKIRLEELKGQ